MKEVVITNPLRTPNGGFGGAFKTVPAYDLAKIVMQRVIADTGIDPGQLDEVILGNCAQPSEALNIARVAAIYAGIPEHVPAYTVHATAPRPFRRSRRPTRASRPATASSTSSAAPRT